MGQVLTTEEMKKRFQQIMEYTVLNGIVDEDENDDAPNTDNTPVEGGNDPDMGDMPPMGNDGPDMGDMSPMGNDGPGIDGNEAGPNGFDPQMDPNMTDPSMDGVEDGIQPEDDVVDISDLTDSMGETEAEVSKLGNKFSEVLGAVKSLERLIKMNDDKINNLRAEYEKRNPTQIEKLSMQTTHSYPFNVTPEEYWKEKEQTSNYSTANDENGVNQGQYVITKNDLEGNVDWKSIANTLDDDDLIYNQSVDNLLKF